MGKLNTANWIQRFETLSPESQLEVANAIRNELHENNSYPDPEDDYDDLKGIELEEEFAGVRGNIREILKANIAQTQDVDKLNDLKGKIQKLGEIEETFKTLTDEEQVIIIKEFISGYISGYNSGMNRVKQLRKEKTCAEEGHIWGKWKIEYTKKWVKWTMDDYYAGKIYRSAVGTGHYKDVPNNWYNKCTRCGLEERRDYKDVPDEIKEERQKQAEKRKEKKRLKDLEAKEKQLIKLQQEIKDLKGNKK